MSLTEQKKYSFYVHVKATKTQVKEAVEKMFDGVKVKQVSTMITHPKNRRRQGYKAGKTVTRKKAIVALTEDSKEIDLYPGL